MSYPEQEEREQRSSVQIEMDSKGLAKVRVKVYEGTEAEVMEAIRRLAVDTFERTRLDVGA